MKLEEPKNLYNVFKSNLNEKLEGRSRQKGKKGH